MRMIAQVKLTLMYWFDNFFYQEKELRSRVEKEALEREWELATRRKESRGGSVTGQESTGQVSRHARLEQNMNQKIRKQK